MSSFRGLFLVLMFATGLSAAPRPINDDFANRTLLVGSSINFNGKSAGATTESKEVLASFVGSRTTWWSWTATETAPVTIQVLMVAKNATGFLDWDCIAVWNPSDPASGFPTNGPTQPAISKLLFTQNMIGQSLIFTGYVGNTYQIQLATGNIDADYRFALIATNAPIIFGPPRDIRVSEGQCAVFTVDATGVLPLSYRWRFNDNDIPGATTPFLGLTNAATAFAGGYSVVVSNATGVSTSSVAHLSVSSSEIAPALAALAMAASNQFQFSLQGEPGRFYRIETSTDLNHWFADPIFPLDPTITSQFGTFTSIALCSNPPSVLSFPALSSSKYVRVSRYAPSSEVCDMFLKEIRHAKNVWARETHRNATETPMDIEIFGASFDKPRCPSGGFYYLGSVDSPPRCSYGHLLEEPR